MTAKLSLAGWLEYIETVHYRSIDLTLDRVRRVAHVLRVPKKACHVVVAGTNGKGSSVAYLEAIYCAAGYGTGAYTSPHLTRYNERVRINGVPVDDNQLVEAFYQVEKARGTIPLTYFEFGTLAALWIFAQSNPDIVILEVGMGGRLDAVNIVDSDIALITRIGLDHQSWLGTQIDQIAKEKAGVLRHGGRAVFSDTHAPRSLLDSAHSRDCDSWSIGIDYGFELKRDTWDFLLLNDTPAMAEPLTGLPRVGDMHQVANAAGALAVVTRLDDIRPADRSAIVDGLAGVRIPGRLQIIEHPSRMILDVAHNIDGLAELAGFLSRQGRDSRLIAVFSMLADKDIEASLAPMGEMIDHWYIAEIDNSRAASCHVLRSAVTAVSSRPVESFACITAALDAARSACSTDDVIVAFGSFHVVGDIMSHLNLDPYPPL
ncbi:MAG: bifunctional folylpolyglutamate synthase/dihydrofolate synthase [marine bacterium B5-7]|nr:MAG: bifunctional folylpolyglutamate synthase/dihydrofolate synthase [marine bacterium B5-7]